MLIEAGGAVLILAAALLYSSVGHGGASGYLAAMALLGVAPEEMRPTALVLNVFVASIATVEFARAGHFRWPIFLPLALASIPAAFLGGRTALSGDAYRLAVGMVLVVSAARFLFALRDVEGPTSRPPLLLSTLAGVVLGFVAGLTGVGGGIFLSPLLVIARWADLRTTAATSAAFILVNSVAGLAGQAPSLHELSPSVWWWIPAAVVGGIIGSRAGSKRLSGRGMRAVLAAVLLVAGLRMLTG